MRVKEAPRARIGVYSAGLHAYWAQFEGLHDRILGYNRFIADRVAAWGEVYNFGLVDSAEAAREAGEYFNAHNVDLVLAHSGTYFTSSALLPVHQICKAPVVLLNLQPTAQMNYAKTDTGEWLAHCVGCPVPEAANAFERAGIELHIVNGLLGLPATPSISMADECTADMPQAKRAWREIEQWVKAAGVKRMLQNARFGFLGNSYSGMLDMYSDCVAMKICDTLGLGGSFCEIVAMDYAHNTMLLGHDGPFHISISDGKPMLRGMGVYHGKKGSGISVEANVISGPITMLGLTQLGNGRLRLIASEGEAVKLPILTIGNTQTHVDFGMDLDTYMDKWFALAPTHHCAMSVGHNAALFEKVAQLLGVEFRRVE